MEQKRIDSDVLIIGGGTAGCYAAMRLARDKNLNIVIVDKADIRRSGCLAAGVNALNFYITEGHEPEDYVEYASKDAHGIVRKDLLRDLAERVNHVTHDMERRGLTILKDENGKYISRGWRNLKINGENIKPILAEEVKSLDNIQIFEHINITDLRQDGKARGAYGFGIRDGAFYEFRAKAVLVATGGAAGLYRPNNPEKSPHQTWYCPFNTGAGYAMGILAGAEMTTFEMRFIALRCKDTIAPTGTIAQGVGAKQVNSRGEIYEDKYGLTTSQRLWGTVTENREGRGPCFLKTAGLDEETEGNLYKAYLNMAPLQTLKWLENGGPSEKNVEIDGTEPYVVGGHTASGYWIDRDRSTTIKGLFAAGDVAGGAPQKYVTGALAEGEIAAEGIIGYLQGLDENEDNEAELKDQSDARRAEYESFLESRHGEGKPAPYSPSDIEIAMQKVMDEYAGGIRTDYRYTEAGLDTAERRINELSELLPSVKVNDTYDLLDLYEVRDRLIVSRVLIAHLRARKETRWHSFQENADHPEVNKEFECYINSVMKDGEIKIIKRNLIG
ncbi:dissimilatory adenylylsulfate reductase alpha subunit precursor [Lachnospiraceae bacterium]|nr:dissimilatory adenylylsulfate reductase alpha subunit precursor [Lachnospiraceae bacterium]